MMDCGSCRFFEPGAYVPAGVDANGACHFHPPTAYLDHRGLWPLVRLNDWCGHYHWQGDAAREQDIAGGASFNPGS